MKRFRVALLISCTRQPWRDLVSGICRFTRLHSAWEFVWVQDSPFTPRPPLEQVALDGVIAMPSLMQSEIGSLRRNLPVIWVGDVAAHQRGVTFDAEAIGVLAAEHFRERGFRHFAFCGMGEFSFSQRRGAAFAAHVPHKIATTSLPLRDDHEVPSAALKNSLRKWIKQLPHPCGLFCATDFVARLCAEVCFQSGLRIPEDVAILGVNNETLHCELSPAPLSSIDIGAQRVGYEAARRLDAWMRGEGVPQSALLPPAGVICRQSTDLLAIEDAVIAQVLQSLRTRSRQTVRIEQLCHEVGLSRRMLELRFRRALGRSPYDELTRLRCENARAMLLSSDATIASIAAQCGFASPNDFHRAFKKRIGQTPNVFRKHHRMTETLPGSFYPSAHYAIETSLFDQM